jgi:hypothetical protein
MNALFRKNDGTGKSMTDQRVLRQGRNLLLAAAVSVMAGCINKPAEPVAPKWDVALTVPVTNKGYTLADLVSRDSTILHTGNGNQLYYATRVTASPSYVGDKISLNPLNVDDSVSLGPFTVGPVPPVPVPVTVPGLVAGQPLPPVSGFPVAPIDVNVSFFREVSVRSGTVALRVLNNLPVALTVDSTITLRDSSGTIITGFTFSPAQIPSGAERVVTADLAGKTLTGKLILANIRLSEPGAPSTPPGTLIAVTVEVTNLVCTRAILSSVPPQVLIDNSRISSAIRDSNKIKEVWIKSGNLDFRIQSAVPMNLKLRVRFEELFDPQGRPFVDSLIVAAQGTTSHQISLAGLQLRSLTGGFLSALTVVGTVDLFEGSRGLPVTVRETDNIRILATSTTLVVDSAVGVVKPTVINVNEAVALKLGDLSNKFSGQLLIPLASLSLEPLTGISFPLLLDLSLRARDASGNEVMLSMPISKTYGNRGPIVFSPQEVGNFLSRLSAKLPDTLRIIGRVILNPDYDTVTVGAVGSRSSFGGLVDLNIPLNVSVGGLLTDVVTFGDTTGDGNSDYRENRDLMQSMNSGKIHLVLDNAVPLAFACKVTLLDHARQPVLSFPQSEGDSLTVSPPLVAVGEAGSAVRSIRTITLTMNEIRALERAQFVQIALGLSTPGTDPVAFRSDQSFRARVWAELSYRVEP